MDSEQLRLFSRKNPLSSRLGPKFFRLLPDAPGVYWMLDGKGRLLYVGMSRNLKGRIGQYRYLKPDELTGRMARVVLGSESIRYHVTPNEVSARLVENELIRRLKPPGNTLGTHPERSLTWIVRSMPRSWRLEVVSPLRQPPIDQTGRIRRDGVLEVGAFRNPARILRLHSSLLRQLRGLTSGRFSLLSLSRSELRAQSARSGVFVDSEINPNIAGGGREADLSEYNRILHSIVVQYLRGEANWPEIELDCFDQWSQHLWLKDQQDLQAAFEPTFVSHRRRIERLSAHGIGMPIAIPSDGPNDEPCSRLECDFDYAIPVELQDDLKDFLSELGA